MPVPALHKQAVQRLETLLCPMWAVEFFIGALRTKQGRLNPFFRLISENARLLSEKVRPFSGEEGVICAML